MSEMAAATGSSCQQHGKPAAGAVPLTSLTTKRVPNHKGVPFFAALRFLRDLLFKNALEQKTTKETKNSEGRSIARACSEKLAVEWSFGAGFSTFRLTPDARHPTSVTLLSPKLGQIGLKKLEKL